MLGSTTMSFVNGGALRNVKLIIEPSLVERGNHAIFKCMYDIQGASLYSVKFYRGQLEFYRFTPDELPGYKVFPYPGFHVDISMSNVSQVVLRNIGFNLSGNFSCEVTADAPSFSTATALAFMQVAVLPKGHPIIWTDQNHYEPGDILRGNCTCPPSRPKAVLTFTLNNILIGNHRPDLIVNSLSVADDLLKMRVEDFSILTQIHSGCTGNLHLDVHWCHNTKIKESVTNSRDAICNYRN
ncbi:uncharacterized protein LOC129612600 [Condylostylus longicornis]|uniref:uncharacterized protein LOC129612600 n=1 Tax=Condylostylus longicornis TaxID=2530218 RepID=UPI00244E47C2|nr:uncharacterized protein LOC129612600 [Condylostylus longicornis]